jgi:Ca-activated chloride channel homolog
VAFAGTAAVKCPLTLDYGFFRTMLKDNSTESISRGGTAIGDALRKAMDEVYTDREKKFKDLILITDGEDHESFPVEAAEEAGKRGSRLLAVGLGNESEGGRIPITDSAGRKTFLTYRGQEVWSRLDGDTLRKMVNVTSGGKYLNVATGSIDLGEVYEQLVATAEKRELESKSLTRYEEKFQIFLGLAFFLLSLELLISERKNNHRDIEAQSKA